MPTPAQTTTSDSPIAPEAQILSLMNAGGGEEAFDAPGNPEDRAPDNPGTPSAEPASSAPPAATEVSEETEVDPREALLQELGLGTPEPSQAAEAGEAGAESPAQADLQAVAATLGLTAEDLSTDESGQVFVKTKVDGVENAVPLDQLRKGYQLESSYTRKTQQLQEEKATWEAQRTQAANQLALQAQIVGNLLNQEEAALQAESQQVDWNALRDEDPAEYSARVTDFQNRAAQIQQRKTQIQEAFAQQYQQDAAQKMQQIEAIRVQEADQLAERLGWDTAASRAEGTARLRTYLQNSGFSDQDLGALYDSRVGVLMDKARRYDELMSKVGHARQVLSAGKPIQGSQGRGGTQDTAKRQATEAVKRHQEVGSVESGAKAILRMGILD